MENKQSKQIQSYLIQKARQEILWMQWFSQREKEVERLEKYKLPLKKVKKEKKKEQRRSI